MRANKEEQAALNLQQAVYNGTNTAAVGCIQGQIAQLQSLTKLIVPNSSGRPGWGEVTVKPATTTAGTRHIAGRGRRHSLPCLIL